MKTLLLSLLFISVTLTAQKKDNPVPVPESDTTKMLNKDKLLGYFALKSDHPQKELYKILSLTPKDTTLYLALKEPAKDYSKYKIPNAITREKLDINPKKTTQHK